MAKFTTDDLPKPGPDFDGDGDVDADDIDALVGEIVAGTYDYYFDLTDDQAIDNDDLNQWLSEAATENGFAAPYLLGDANLDGSVDATDLNALALSWRQDTALWSAGDFTADGKVDAADLNGLALNWRQSIPTASNEPVPEPAALFLAVIGLGLICRRYTNVNDVNADLRNHEVSENLDLNQAA